MQSAQAEGWRLINRPNYSSADLLNAARAVPQLVNYNVGEMVTDLVGTSPVAAVAEHSATKRSSEQDGSRCKKQAKKESSHNGTYESDPASEDGESP